MNCIFFNVAQTINLLLTNSLNILIVVVVAPPQIHKGVQKNKKKTPQVGFYKTNENG